jgi:hypothetical protein
MNGMKSARIIPYARASAQDNELMSNNHYKSAALFQQTKRVIPSGGDSLVRPFRNAAGQTTIECFTKSLIVHLAPHEKPLCY